MKLLWLISLIVSPVLGHGQVCKPNNPMLNQWKVQQYWKSMNLEVSKKNPHIQFKSYVDEDHNVFIKNFDINDTYKANIDMDINSSYSKKKFLRMCRDNYKGGKYLSSSRKSSANKNFFKLKVSYLPGASEFVNDPYKNQSLVTEKNGLGVRIILKPQSMLKRNTYFPSSATKIVKDMVSVINQSLQKQIESGFQSQVVVHLDHMDDLVCDLMKGEAELEFFHFSRMRSPLVDKVSGVDNRDVERLYDEIRVETEGEISSAKNLYFSGQVAERLVQNNEIKISDKDQSYEIVSQFFKQDMSGIKDIDQKELNCIADNQAEFEQNQYDNSIILNVMVPQVHEFIEEN